MNTIAERIYDFLKGFPPFNMLSKNQLLSISQKVEVIYLEKNSSIFEIDQPVKNHFYVVKEGAIGLFKSGSTLVDECDEGDIFGLRALLRKGDYILSAIAIEESILYSISSELLEDYITTNAEASKFLMASFVSNINYLNSAETENFTTALVNDQTISELQSADYSKNPVTCSEDTTIKTAALQMTEKHVGSIIVTNNKRPIGIITDKDLRTKIATGITDISEKVTKIMSTPVVTFPENISVAEAQIAMLKNKITHLCITKDGTVNSELTGILSEHDIIVLRENNASVLVKEIKRSTSSTHLKTLRQKAELLIKYYLEQQIPIDFVARLISAINTAITQRVIQLSLLKLEEKPPISFAWISIGSQGREEQLLLTDQDNGLVFEDVSAEKYDSTKSYFLKLAQLINNSLETIGFQLCPANMMASNPKWCLSVSQWNSQFKRWITTPDEDNLMFCSIFFDYECIYGNTKLVASLTDHIFKSIASHDIFLNYLGLNALQNPPPLSFFRQFLVEDNGEHKDQFDIKARAIMPLVDAARLLILSHNIKSVNNTIERYKTLSQLEPENEDTYLFCIEAFKDLLRFRTEQGLVNNNSGRFIDLESLSKANRLKLKQSFKAVKAIQSLIQTRFKLAQLM